MYSHWPTAAKGAIERAVADLSEDASLKERKSALRRAANDFHGGTSWGKKVWSRECRKYLERHGLPPRTPADRPELFGPDICFPYRKDEP